MLNGRLVVMLEHQSSVNENMPFRFLQSISQIFENGIPDKKAVYRRKLVRLPQPEFIALINAMWRNSVAKIIFLSAGLRETDHRFVFMRKLISM